ncbi:MAG: hypothetical protein ACYTBJ_17305 [Planctomycetota bacterium]|jgi:hypothetical protein
MTNTKMIDKFQCLGCVCGGAPATECGRYELHEEGGCFFCVSHVPGTRIMPTRSSLLCLGLPKGFCRLSHQRENGATAVRLWAGGHDPGWDNANVAVWAMEKNGYLFVRTVAPRIDLSWIDVIEGGTLELCPTALNVAEFIDEID